MQKMELEEQEKELTEQALVIASKAASEFIDNKGIQGLDKETLMESIKTEVAREWNPAMKFCRKTVDASNNYSEMMFQVSFMEAGIEAVKNISLLA